MRDSPLWLARYLLPLNRFRFRSSLAFCLRLASYFCLSTFCFAFALHAVHFGHGRGRNQLISLSKFESNLIDSTTVSQFPLSVWLSLSHTLFFIWLFSLVATNCVNCCSPHLHLLHICPHQISWIRSVSSSNIPEYSIPGKWKTFWMSCHCSSTWRRARRRIWSPSTIGKP